MSRIVMPAAPRIMPGRFTTRPGTPTAVKTSAYTANFGEIVMVDPSGGEFTITLPALSAGRIGDFVAVQNTTADVTGVKIVPSGSDTIGGLTFNYLVPAYGYVLFTATTASLWIAEGTDVKLWFKWNATDLTQFDAKVEAAAVTSSTVQVVTVSNQKWISISSTGTGGAGAAARLTLIPITRTPPLASNRIDAQFLNWVTASSDIAGAYLIQRYTAVSSMYSWIAQVNDGTNAPMYLLKFNGDTVGSQLGVAQADPNLFTEQEGGQHLGFTVMAGTILITHRMEEQLQRDPSSPITVAGQCAIGTSPGGAAGPITSENYFREIECRYVYPNT